MVTPYFSALPQHRQPNGPAKGFNDPGDRSSLAFSGAVLLALSITGVAALCCICLGWPF